MDGDGCDMQTLLLSYVVTANQLDYNLEGRFSFFFSDA